VPADATRRWPLGDVFADIKLTLTNGEEQSAQTTAAAVALQRSETTEREMVELRARVATAEAAIAEVALAVARIQGGKPNFRPFNP